MELRDDYRNMLDKYSLAMRMSRIICILGMVYVHVHLFTAPELQNSTHYVLTRSVLVEFFGRASVPLLSVLSGFLMFGYFARKPYMHALKARAIVLLLPLAVWNVLALLLDFARSSGDGFSFTINQIIPLWDDGRLPALNFLRDLFLVSAATPVIVQLLRRYHWFAMIAVVAVGLKADLAPLLMRNQILTYYTVGVFIAIYRLNVEIYLGKIRYVALAGAASLLLVIVLEALLAIPLYSALPAGVFDDLLRRPIGALTFWFAALWLAQYTRSREFLATHIEPAVFLLFLSHNISKDVFGSLYASAQTLHTPAFYTLVWLIIPFACLAVAVLCAKTVLHLPRIAALGLAGKA